MRVFRLNNRHLSWFYSCCTLSLTHNKNMVLSIICMIKANMSKRSKAKSLYFIKIHSYWKNTVQRLGSKRKSSLFKVLHHRWNLSAPFWYTCEKSFKTKMMNSVRIWCIYRDTQYNSHKVMGWNLLFW